MDKQDLLGVFAIENFPSNVYQANWRLSPFISGESEFPNNP
jgi:hypothetical protein